MYIRNLRRPGTIRAAFVCADSGPAAEPEDDQTTALDF